MLITTIPEVRDNLKLETKDKKGEKKNVIKHQNNLRILVISISHDLK